MDNFNNIIYQAKFLVKTNWIQAVHLLENATLSNPKAKELYLELADIYNQKKSQKKAIDNYQKVINIDPNDNFARFKLGNIYLEMEEPKLAIYHYDKISDDYPEALYNKALAYYHMLQYDNAIKTLKKLVELDFIVQSAHLFLIELLLSSGKIDDGFKYIAKAEKTHGYTHQIHYLKGFAYSQQKNWLAAYSEYLKALPGFLDNPKIHHMLGITAENIGQVDKSIEHIKNAILLDKKDKLPVIDLIKVLVKYHIITDKKELKALLKDMDDDIIKMAVKFYGKLVLNDL